ncbi:uncharacterized protein LOC135629437 [Musa acuminata AAA Group]|uniref:uncharacterized protein LOC135629437 n=1 Tax=Musa acuminata AAA Group TaxID=214697 RepID=UPI0031D266D5
MGRLEAQTLASRRGPCAPPLPPPESRPPADASRRRLPRRHPDRRRGRGESDGSRNLGRREGEEGGAEECRHRDAGESVRRRGSRRPQLASGLHGGAPGVHRAVAASPPDKVKSVTGIKNPIQAGQELISRGERTKWVIIKLGSMGSILINSSTVMCTLIQD